jgi:hypothetical protein
MTCTYKRDGMVPTAEDWACRLVQQSLAGARTDGIVASRVQWRRARRPHLAASPSSEGNVFVCGVADLRRVFVDAIRREDARHGRIDT